MSDKPLNVRVAEKLGIVECSAWKLWGTGLSGPEYTNEGCTHKAKCVPVGNPFNKYDQSWALTGPLIERFKITLRTNFKLPEYEKVWPWAAAYTNPITGNCVLLFGDTALIAVCNLILDMPDEVARDSSQVA